MHILIIWLVIVIISHIRVPLDSFISTQKLSGYSPMYVEVLKNNDSIDQVYDVKIYKKCDYALTYSMYLREMAYDLYEYLQKQPGEIDSDYKERLDKFSSTIIATIENSIESKKIKKELKLSYTDFSNISKYIKLIINVFKSYSIDLSAMDTIYNIDDKINNRIKLLENISTKEKYGIDSNIKITSDLSYNETNFTKDLFTIKDELYIEFYANQFYDDDKPLSSDVYYRINNNIPDIDYMISSYYYGRSIERIYTLRDDINDIIGK